MSVPVSPGPVTVAAGLSFGFCPVLSPSLFLAALRRHRREASAEDAAVPQPTVLHSSPWLVEHRNWQKPQPGIAFPANLCLAWRDLQTPGKDFPAMLREGWHIIPGVGKGVNHFFLLCSVCVYN